MNVAAACLARHADRLELPAGAATPDRLAWIAVTPRFRTSAHVIFLAVADGASSPELVAKVARLPGRSDTLDREAATLRAVHAARVGGFDSVPRLVANEVIGGSHLLVETGLRGRPMDAPLVSRRPHECADGLLAWVTGLHLATARPTAATRADLTRLLADPIDELEARLSHVASARDLITRTRELLGPLRDLAIPLVLAHGDLGAPNILVSATGRLGVVDWELAEEESLPAQDLFFALAYLAFARARARSAAECVAAFRGAFFGPGAWARPYVTSYVEALGLPREAIEPLFHACWIRYVARRAVRLMEPGAGPLGADATAWLQTDRFHAVWSHGVRHADALCLMR